MRINCIMHVAEEGPAAIGQWAKENDCPLFYTRLYQRDPFPELEDFDLLLVMGGPMSYDDDTIYDWMRPEKEFIRNAINAGKCVLGICLGSQFIAEALGSSGRHGHAKEIGWFPIRFDTKRLAGIGLKDFPETQVVFHWHGDTFEIPAGAEHFASTDEFPNQAFVYNKKVFGLQFHLEATSESVEKMVDAFRHELIPNTYIQSDKDILSIQEFIKPGHQLLFQILRHLAQQ